MKIRFSPDYYAIEIMSIRDWQDSMSYKERRLAALRWYKRIREKFPKFDNKRYMSESSAIRALAQIKQVFPDAPLEIQSRCDVYF